MGASPVCQTGCGRVAYEGRGSLTFNDNPGNLLLVIEGFAGDEKFMFQTNELLRDFADLKILRYEDTQGEAAWSPGHKSHIIRLVAEKIR